VNNLQLQRLETALGKEMVFELGLGGHNFNRKKFKVIYWWEDKHGNGKEEGI
jgi:hypothetical protein